ncbi:MAG: hypothetical protein KME47_09775 [Nodosilinea sp. WJT8-NPBG4]|jgi:hypothetical protein|nr:hypothetical protein [Nodosilinea sp. WJT8-NPBG4]
MITYLPDKYKDHQPLLDDEVTRDWLNPDIGQPSLHPLTLYPVDAYGGRVMRERFYISKKTGEIKSRKSQVRYTSQYQVPNLDQDFELYLHGLGAELLADPNSIVSKTTKDPRKVTAPRRGIQSHLAYIGHVIYCLMDKVKAIEWVGHAQSKSGYAIDYTLLPEMLEVDWQQVSLEQSAKFVKKSCGDTAYTGVDYMRFVRNNLAALGCFDVDASYVDGRRYATNLSKFKINRLLHVYEYLEHCFLSKADGYFTTQQPTLADLPGHKNFLTVLAHEFFLGRAPRRSGKGSESESGKCPIEEMIVAEKVQAKKASFSIGTAVQSVVDASIKTLSQLRRCAIKAWEAIGGTIIPKDSFNRPIEGLARSIDWVITWFQSGASVVTYYPPDVSYINESELVEIDGELLLITDEDIQFSSIYYQPYLDEIEYKEIEDRELVAV